MDRRRRRKARAIVSRDLQPERCLVEHPHIEWIVLCVGAQNRTVEAILERECECLAPDHRSVGLGVEQAKGEARFSLERAAAIIEQAALLGELTGQRHCRCRPGQAGQEGGAA
jgi:hypothetical protein